MSSVDRAATLDPPIDPEKVAELATRIQGPVLTPADEAYDAERSGNQTARRHQPDVIIGAPGAADV